MKAITVCVDYSDYLAITLPKNRHYFDEYMVVTTPTDIATIQIATKNECSTFVTNVFYENALFNKWAALEQGLTSLGRDGWICIMDADIVWPQEARLNLIRGNLYVPERYHSPLYIPEIEWSKATFKKDEEFAGYCQIFHASDPVLGRPPWHQINWKHAGGADSFFAMKWDTVHRVRPPFRVLHLGVPGLNWCGRITPYPDGTVPQEAEQRAAQLQQFLDKRKATHKFTHEKF